MAAKAVVIEMWKWSVALLLHELKTAEDPDDICFIWRTELYLELRPLPFGFPNSLVQDDIDFILVDWANRTIDNMKIPQLKTLAINWMQFWMKFMWSVTLRFQKTSVFKVAEENDIVIRLQVQFSTFFSIVCLDLTLCLMLHLHLCFHFSLSGKPI